MTFGMTLGMGQTRSPLANFTANGYTPQLAISPTFSSVGWSSLTFSRSSTATMIGSSGDIVSVGSGEPRRGHHVWNGSEWVKTAMLVEPSRTNLLAYSNNAENWTVVAQNLTRSVITGPDGQTASQWVASDTSSLSRRTKTSGIAGVTGQLSAAQFKVKDLSCRYLRLSWLISVIDFDLVSLTSTAAWASFTPLADGWLLVRVPITPNATATDGASFYPLTSISGTEANAGPGVGNGFALCDVQFEVGGYPTTFIPTNGSTVTRAADTFEIPAAVLPTITDAFSFALKGFISYADNGSATEATLFDWRADANNRITLTLDTSSTNTGTLTLTMVNGGSSASVSTTAELTPGVDVEFGVAFRCSDSEINIAFDGTAETATATAIGLPDLSSADIDLSGATVADTLHAFWTNDIGDAGIEEASS